MRQCGNLPPDVAALLSHGGDGGERDLQRFRHAWDVVRQHIDYATQGVSIDELVELLEQAGCVPAVLKTVPPRNTYQPVNDRGHHSEARDGSREAKQQLVFALLGWQCMIYEPYFGMEYDPRFFQIDHPDEVEPPMNFLNTGGRAGSLASPWGSGLVVDSHRVLAQNLSRRPLWAFLRAFGNLLPASSGAGPGHYLGGRGSAAAEAAWKPIYPSELNVHVLQTLLRVRIRWVDAMGQHLDYDSTTRTLSLFRWPSLCMHHLHEHYRLRRYNAEDRDGKDAAAAVPGSSEQGSSPQGPVYPVPLYHDGAGEPDPIVPAATLSAFACPVGALATHPSASHDDLAHLAQEVLMSYRLLFGLSAKARRVFRSVRPREAADDSGHGGGKGSTGGCDGESASEKSSEAPHFLPPDMVLEMLCSEDVVPENNYMPPDRPIYYGRDFPVLQERIIMLSDELERVKPKTTRDLLRDRRDPLQYLTFLSIFILIGISVIQTVLQAVQIAQAAGRL